MTGPHGECPGESLKVVVHAPKRVLPKPGHVFPNSMATPSEYNPIIKFTFEICASILLMRLMESQIERKKLMERNINTSIDEIIDLGSVSEETRGSVLGHDDTLGGRQINAGLSDD